MLARVRYSEAPLPPALDGLVAAIWNAEVDAGPPDWIEQEAVPDGCIELIRRHSGRSVWRTEQPALFATGLATVAARLRLGAGARFTGIKLWPWAWHALGGARCTRFADDWIAVEETSPLAALLVDDDTVERLVQAFAAVPSPTFGRAILGGGSVAGIAARAGMPLRQLQRRFAAEFGMPPRGYLRLLRFRGALADLQQCADTLADTAAAQGYADQAHMAREFRSLAGMPPREARVRAKGPFV